MKKTLTIALAFVLVIAMSVAGTLAYLTSTTAEVKNTFTVGKVAIDLAETTENYKMVPGENIDKDPKVTVNKGSEDCWLFVTIAESENLGTYIEYSVADGWNELKPGVYYREVKASDADQVFSVLAGDKVSVLGTVTSADMANATGENQPTLTFKAYAIQKAGFDTAATAWAEVSK